jgi:superfamily II DNA or RNA helicase
MDPGPNDARPSHAAATAPAHTANTANTAIQDWLKQYETDYAPRLKNPPTPTNDYPPNIKDRIRYIVNQNHNGVTVHPVKVMVRKDGSRSPGGAYYYNHGNANLESPPRFVLPIDVQILRLLRGAPRNPIGSDVLITDDEQGQALFELLLQTGRAHWAHEDGVQLRLAKPRKGEFAWRDLGEAQALMVRLQAEGEGEGEGETWVEPLAMTPPGYFDPETGDCGRLETSLAPVKVKWLANAPAVPAEDTEQMVEAMSTLDPDLPRPKAIAQEHVDDIKPTPVLTLGAIGAREQNRYMLFSSHDLPFDREEIAPCLRLSFDYGGQRINADNDERYIRHVADGQLQRIKRHLKLERTFLRRLVDDAEIYDFYPAAMLDDEADLDTHEPNDLVLWPFDSSDPLAETGGGLEALDFMEQVLPVLREAGWVVVFDDSWPIPMFEGTPQIMAGLGEQDNNWFSLALNYEVDGQEFDLLPVLTKLVNSLDEQTLENDEALQAALAGRRFNVRLKDGRYARLPIDPLIPALRCIRDLNQQVHTAQATSLRDLADALSGSGIPFNGGEQLLELGSRLRALAQYNIAPEVTVDPSLSPALPPSFEGDLRPYQRIGMAWLLALADTGFGGVLADDMGLGKTVQTLAFLATRKHNQQQVQTRVQVSNDTAPDKTTPAETAPDEDTPALPCLLVVPTSLVSNWQREAKRFVPDLRVLALQGPDRHEGFSLINQHDLVITTYPLLHRDHHVLFEHDYDTVLLDEAQAVKNPTSQAAKLIREVKARQRIALTGTPMENNLEELWCLFDWLIPGMLGSRKSFSDNFRKPIEKENNVKRQTLLSRRISPFILRRTKDQVVTDLPPRTEMVENVQLVGAQRGLYETVRATMHKRVREALNKKGLAASKITLLDALLKLRQACCDPQLLKVDSARKVTTSAKRARLMELLESLMAEGRRVLVFSQFVEMLRLIETDIKAQGWDYLMLTGQSKKRGDLVDAFQSGKANIFLISLKAGGVGLNLTAADTVILYDPWWNPAIERQAMDRAHRIGQDKPVFVHRLIAEGTVETRIAEMQARKQALMDSVFDPEATGTMDMSEEEILSLFAPITD